MKNLIYITGQGRAGGSLISRILDGNKEFASFPFEYRYHKDNIFPDFDKKINLISFLKESDQLKNFELFFSNRNRKNREFDCSEHFDKIKFFNNLKNTNTNSMNFVETINCVSKIFFESNINNFYDWQNVKYIAWHASKPTVDDIDSLLSRSEGRLKIIHIVRSPFDQISSSLKKHRRYFKKLFLETPYKLFSPSIAKNFYLPYKNKMSLTLEPEFAAHFWLHSVYQGQYYSNKYPENYFLIRYEDVVNDIKNFSSFLENKLGLNERLNNTNPTHIGCPWKSNSSFSQSKDINTKSIGRFKQFLSEKEINIIKEITSPILFEMGYLDNEPFISDMKKTKISLPKYINCMSSMLYTLRKHKK